MRDAQSERRHLPIACALSGPELADRREVVEEIFGGRLRDTELEDGHEFVFPGDGEWAARLTEFIVFERGCCAFLAFELLFEPEDGPIRLRIRAPEEAGDIVPEMFASRVG